MCVKRRKAVNILCRSPNSTADTSDQDCALIQDTIGSSLHSLVFVHQSDHRGTWRQSCGVAGIPAPHNPPFQAVSDTINAGNILRE